MTDPRLRQVMLLAESWKRAPDDLTRRLGADLAQVLDYEDDMPAGFNRPVKVNGAILVGVLRDMADAIEENDSAGGFVEYEWAAEPGRFEVRASYRVGNAMGQGGVRTLHDAGA